MSFSSFQILWLDYSLSIPIIVIVVVAPAEELLVLLVLVVASLLAATVSSIEMTLSLGLYRISPATIITGMTKGFFASTTSQCNYARRYRITANFLKEIVSSDTLCFLA